MIRGLRSRGSTSAHLTFGLHYHAALELYDKLRAEGEDHEVSVRAVVLDLLRRTWIVEPDEYGYTILGQGKPWQSDHHLKTRETLVRSVVWYLEEFGENDPIQTVILANGKPAVELTFKFDSGIIIDPPIPADGTPLPSLGGPVTYILSGHLDRVGLFGGDPYIIDRKTSSTALTASFFSQFNPHTQMTLYTIAGRIVYNIPIRGVIIDGAQVQVGFTRFGRAPTQRTEGQLEEFLTDLAQTFRLAETYAAQRYWPQNPASCHNYGGCPFRRICTLDPSHRETFIRQDYEERKWNPLQER